MPAPSQSNDLRLMSDVEAAWIGALVDGEGSVCYIVHPGQGRSTRRFDVGVVNTEVELLSACLRLTQCGSVYHKPASPKGPFAETRPCFAWKISRWSPALALLRRIRPYSLKAQAGLNRLASDVGAPV